MKKMMFFLSLIVFTISMVAGNPYYYQQRTGQNRQSRYYNQSQTTDPYGGSYIGQDSRNRSMYRGRRGGEYYVNPNSNRSYYTPPTTYQRENIQNGSRGGQYYINTNGNKTYIRQK